MSYGIKELIDVLQGKSSYRVFCCPQQYEAVSKIVNNIEWKEIFVEVYKSDFVLYNHVIITGPSFEYKAKLNNLYTLLETFELDK